jgi:hypothetical protein
MVFRPHQSKTRHVVSLVAPNGQNTAGNLVMKCMICGSDSRYYFSKAYSESPFDEFMRDIGPVDYYRCQNCGFVLSRTHSELDESKWGALNLLFHHYIENPANEKRNNQPPYAEQAMMLCLLAKNGIIRTDSMIDYAAGYGTLSSMLSKYFGIELPTFDPYVQTADSTRYIAADRLKTHKTVINSAMFEHVLRREDLDRVNDLVDEDGCLILHTVVCERVPPDPNWFYLRPPVHTAFHTNKSMQILMDQWGYRSSIYCPPSKCWVLLKDDPHHMEDKVRALNEELQTDWFHYKKGFVDYWKGFWSPARRRDLAGHESSRRVSHPQVHGSLQ